MCLYTVRFPGGLTSDLAALEGFLDLMVPSGSRGT